MSSMDFLPPHLNQQQIVRPFVRIVEQPSKSLRYRYLCERRPGTIPGASSTPENKTHFAIEIVGYQGPVIICVSCVTKDKPFKPHPHNLVGENCKKGVCIFGTNVTENSVIKFQKLAVQCVKRNDVRKELTMREEKQIDPFSTGFDHKNNVKSIDLNVVRLCFQVFLQNENGKIPLNPVVSDPIYNRKTFPEPVIYRLSHCNSPVNGRQDDIILLCTKISKDDVKIRFFEMDKDQIIWEDFGTFLPNSIYNNTAICFKPPRYYKQDIIEPVRVMLQLVRPSDGISSSSIDFEYLPLEAELDFLKEKRKKYQDYTPLFVQLLEDNDKEKPLVGCVEMNTWEEQNSDYNKPSTSKIEPREKSSNTSFDDFSFGLNINIETVNDVCQILNTDCNQLELEPIHISSGDLEMDDMERLSGNLQQNLVL